jgi:hypothetical protein
MEHQNAEAKGTQAVAHQILMTSNEKYTTGKETRTMYTK